MLSIEQDILTRLRNVENQLFSMQAANQLEELALSDGTNLRILLDGVNGKFKISLPGYNVVTATSSQLIYSSDFGAVVESHYRLTAAPSFSSSSSFVFAGPQNAVTGNNDPIKTLVNLADYKNILFYLEANMSGQNSAVCEAQLYCVTNSSAVSGSVIDSVSGSTPVRVRSSAITLFNGINEYAVQYRRVGGTSSDAPNCEEAHLVTRVTI